MIKENSVVYVIDDDDSIRRAFSRLFRSVDIAAETFPGPEDFLAGERQEENACIIADLHMPGSTGFDLERDLTNRGLKIPLIVVSASDDTKSREHARTLGAVAFFRKPVDDQALLDAVWWALSEAAGKNKEK
jgi:FixJ family two-component response regulator